MYPTLSLAEVDINPELARRLPRHLAYYHLALPIAQDDDAITVAMAYPDNQQVVEVIRTALGTALLMPVVSRADEIRQALDKVWETETGALLAGRIYCWTANPAHYARLHTYTAEMAATLGRETADIEPSLALNDFCDQMLVAHPSLVVCETTDTEVKAALVTGLPSSMLLIGEFVPPRRILHVLRGHTPDKHVLEWIIPLARHYDAEITLLAATTSVTVRQGNPLISDLARLILPEHPAQVVEYGQMLASLNLRGRIKVVDGLLEPSLGDVLKAAPYDLVAIATETNGKFVQNMLSNLKDYTCAFLVIKP